MIFIALIVLLEWALIGFFIGYRSGVSKGKAMTMRDCAAWIKKNIPFGVTTPLAGTDLNNANLLTERMKKEAPGLHAYIEESKKRSESK